ncbi:hypothetical protein Q9R29_08475 [Rothia sp. ARF10]|nr:hypothetical protein [Rothia sp. ARF10]
MFTTDAHGTVQQVPLARLADGSGPQSLIAVTPRPQLAIPAHSRMPGAAGAQASALAIVLRACAASVGARTLTGLGASRAQDLTMFQLALAHRPDDTGLLGDVFELAVLDAINRSDPVVLGLLASALQMLREGSEILGAVTAAAEGGRAKVAALTLPEGTALKTGRPGRPALARGLLERADTRTWKNDILLLTPGPSAIAMTVKSNPVDARSHVAATRGHPLPPRIAIVPSGYMNAGVWVDREFNVPVVKIPATMAVMSLLHSSMEAVQSAFARGLKPYASPLRDPSEVVAQLCRWRDDTVGVVLDRLDEVALEWRGGQGAFTLSAPSAVVDADGGTAPSPGSGLVVAVDALDTTKSDPWTSMESMWHRPRVDSFSFDRLP